MGAVVQWSEQYPGDGDLSDVERIAGFLSAAADRAEELAAAVESVNRGVTEQVWRGDARDAWGDRLVEESRRLWPLAETFRRGARVLRTYVSEVEEIEVLVGLEHGTIDAIERAVLACEALEFRSDGMWSTAWCQDWRVTDLLVAGGAAPGLALASPLLPCAHAGQGPRPGIRDGLEGEAWAKHVSAEIAWHCEEILALGERRRTADDRFTDGLRSVLPVSWAQERAAFESIGITDPRLMVAPRTDVGTSGFAAIVSMVAGISAAAMARELDQDGLTRAERIELADALTRATAGHDTDQVFWTAFFEGFPPDELPGAMLSTFPTVAELPKPPFSHAEQQEALGLQDSAHEAFASVRGGLALYAGSLPYEEQSLLGKELTSAAMGEERFGGRTLSFLMADPRLPGGVFAGAMTELDSLERVQGLEWVDGTGGTIGDRPGLGESASADPAVVILEGISRNPAGALDFFSPHASTSGLVPVASVVSEARIEHWVRDRDYADNLTAISAAIAAATASPVNTDLADTATGVAPDTGRDERAAWTLSVVSGVIDERTDLNDLSEDAALSLTAAFAPHAAQGIARIDPEPERDEHGNWKLPVEGFEPRIDVGHPAKVYALLAGDVGVVGLKSLPGSPVPNVSAVGLQAVVSAATRHESALGAWMVAAVGQREELFDLAFSESITLPDDTRVVLSADDRRALIEQGVETEAGIVGMAAEAAVQRGEDVDTVVKEITDVTVSATGWIAGGGMWRPVIDYAGGKAAGVITDATSLADAAENAAAEVELSVWGEAETSLEARTGSLPEPRAESLVGVQGEVFTTAEAKLGEMSASGEKHFWKQYRGMHNAVAPSIDADDHLK